MQRVSIFAHQDKVAISAPADAYRARSKQSVGRSLAADTLLNSARAMTLLVRSHCRVPLLPVRIRTHWAGSDRCSTRQTRVAGLMLYGAMAPYSVGRLAHQLGVGTEYQVMARGGMILLRTNWCCHRRTAGYLSSPGETALGSLAVGPICRLSRRFNTVERAHDARGEMTLAASNCVEHDL